MNDGSSDWLRPVLVAGLATSLVAALGATVSQIGPWYHALNKPDWTPPDFAFGLIWTLVFSLVALSGILAWRAARGDRSRESIIGVFALNGVLNILWSLFFFRLQRPDWGMIEVVFLWISIVAMIGVAGRASRRAGWLLLPYLLWVSVAALLNYEVVHRNGPFG
jgi:translocator protein